MPEQPFTPIHPNPYIVGNPVRDPSMFFGREKDFQMVVQRFQDTERGGLLVFCGERRSGKTSILFQILDGCLGEEFLPVLIDMQAMAIEDEVDFFAKITLEILRTLEASASGLNPPDYRQFVKPSSAFMSFVEQLLRIFPDKKIILLFDEYELFESKIESNQLSRDILYAFSNLMENSAVYFIFTGSQHLQQRRKDYWEILGKSLHRRISYLHHSDAISLITRPLEGEIEFTENTVERIYRLAAGQPFYTQAICQNVVDLLNENHTREVTDELVKMVVSGMVDNPLPQMMFLWDGLTTNEKLALALLAETLTDDEGYAKAEDLLSHVSKKKYPLDSGRAPIATALEELFHEELLSKDPEDPSRYHFRMDLWRLWIVRMHSVWQVIHEEGIAPPTRPVWHRYALSGLGALALLAVAVGIGNRDRLWPEERSRIEPTPVLTPVPVTGPGLLRLDTRPTGARIYEGDQLWGTAPHMGSLEPSVDHEFRIASAGYADTVLVINVAPDSTAHREIALRPLTGSLRVETTPRGAAISVDGELRGSSPITLEMLTVVRSHEVLATLDGYQPGRESFEVVADTTITARISLAPVTISVRFTTSPSGAELTLDGTAQGRTPLTVSGIIPGALRVRMQLERHVSADTLVTFEKDTEQVRIALDPEPPAILVVTGDVPATIYIDGSIIVENVQNSLPRELIPGDHDVLVLTVRGEEISKTIRLDPGERVIYDYSRDSVEPQ